MIDRYTEERVDRLNYFLFGSEQRDYYQGRMEGRGVGRVGGVGDHGNLKTEISIIWKGSLFSKKFPFTSSLL